MSRRPAGRPLSLRSGSSRSLPRQKEEDHVGTIHREGIRLATPRGRHSPPQLADVFDTWNQGELRSDLLEITARIVAFSDDQGTGDVLLDRIDDRFGRGCTLRKESGRCLSF